jgi:hypothetical protein
MRPNPEVAVALLLPDSWSSGQPYFFMQCSITENVLPLDINWLELQSLAQVELTSEDEAHQIESALIPGTGSGGRAALPGEQVIRLLFDEPQRIRRIRLLFHEAKIERTQEFALRWSPDGGKSYHEIVRQQYNFSPPVSTCEGGFRCKYQKEGEQSECYG